MPDFFLLLKCFVVVVVVFLFSFFNMASFSSTDSYTDI